jgi:hypothetical protein
MAFPETYSMKTGNTFIFETDLYINYAALTDPAVGSEILKIKFVNSDFLGTLPGHSTDALLYEFILKLEDGKAAISGTDVKLDLQSWYNFAIECYFAEGYAKIYLDSECVATVNITANASADMTALQLFIPENAVPVEYFFDNTFVGTIYKATEASGNYFINKEFNFNESTNGAVGGTSTLVSIAKPTEEESDSWLKLEKSSGYGEIKIPFGASTTDATHIDLAFDLFLPQQSYSSGLYQTFLSGLSTSPYNIFFILEGSSGFNISDLTSSSGGKTQKLFSLKYDTVYRIELHITMTDETPFLAEWKITDPSGTVMTKTSTAYNQNGGDTVKKTVSQLFLCGQSSATGTMYIDNLSIQVK